MFAAHIFISASIWGLSILYYLYKGLECKCAKHGYFNVLSSV